MDSRQALQTGSELDLHDIGLKCTIESEIGRGSNAIVYLASYPDQLNTQERHTVLIKELFPFHPDAAIYRAEDGSIVREAEGEACWQLQKRSFENGNRIHLLMTNRHPELTGENWNTAACHGTLYTVLGFTGGRSLEAEMATPESDLRRLAQRMLLLLEALEDFHSEGFLHLDIAPDNILLIGNDRRERVMLIDYNSVHELEQVRNASGAAFSKKEGYTAPEIRTRRYASVCKASDLYSVTAVFFRCLTGAPLTLSQMIRPVPPDVSGCPALQSQPDTVRDMVQEILYQGLQSLPRNRIGTVREMRRLFQELLDRIDGFGLTHWALWEAGKKTAYRVIQDNPAFSYILEDELFPSDVRAEEGPPVSVQQFIDSMMLPGSCHRFLTAPGGMGKSTALLRAAWLHTQRYSPAETALLYVPLLGYQKGEQQYVVRRVLERLRFRQSDIDAQRHLRGLLDEPLQTGQGECPVLLLLLDGLNEVSAPTDALLKEIGELAALRGVRILLTSRSGQAPEGFSPAVLSPLSEESVTRRLSEKGLRLPESVEMKVLLRTPLMLSLFLRASQAEDMQLSVQNANGLIEAYYRSLVEKAKRDTPKDTQVQWQIKAAVELVLPAIAHEIRRKGRPLADSELLPLAEKLYRLTRRKRLFKLFQWEGYTADIRGGTENAEEWYGLIVHRILWKKLALLIRTNDGKYQLCHEIIGDYLSTSGKRIVDELIRSQVIRRSCALLLIAAILTGAWSVWPKPDKPTLYDETTASEILKVGETAYQYAICRTEALLSAVEESAALAEQMYPSSGDTVSPEEWSSLQNKYAVLLDNYQNNAGYLTRLSKDTGISYSSAGPLSEDVRKLLSSGTCFASSGEPFSEQDYWNLLAAESGFCEDYEQLIKALSALAEYRPIEEWYGAKYRSQLEQLAQNDAEIAEVLFCLAVLPHLPDDAFDVTTLQYIGSGEAESLIIPEREALEERLQALLEARNGSGGILSEARNTAEAILDLNERF